MTATTPREDWIVSSGGPLRGLVLDLRDNPGGVLEAAVGVSDVFLDGGLIVTANGRAPDALLLEVFTGAGCGTMIVGRKEKATYLGVDLAG